jgi:hypothetical protein
MAALLADRYDLPAELIDASLERGISMKCVLCCEKSADAEIEQFPLSPDAREALRKQYGLDPDEDLAGRGICAKCLALPRELAEKAIKDEENELRRYLMKEVLNMNRN